MADTEILNKLVGRISELREKEAAASKIKRDISSELELEEMRLIEMLAESNLTSYRSSFGLASLSYFTSVKTPKTPEDIALLAEYARGVGQYDAVFKPGSAAVNSFYKEQMELAKENGFDDFNVPGLREVTIEPRLSFRKA